VRAVAAPSGGRLVLCAACRRSTGARVERVDGPCRGPDWGWEFCRARHACTFVSLPEMGHAPFDLDRWTDGDCLDQIASAFLANPAHIDTACVARMRPPSFR